MKNKIVRSTVIITTLLMLIPSVFSTIIYDEPPDNVTIKIPDAISSLQLLIDVSNTGSEDITNIAMFGEIQKIVGLVIIGDIFTASIASLSAGETETLQTQLQFGIGLMNYNASACWDNCTVYYDRNYLLIGILIIPL